MKLIGTYFYWLQKVVLFVICYAESTASEIKSAKPIKINRTHIAKSLNSLYSIKPIIQTGH